MADLFETTLSECKSRYGCTDFARRPVIPDSTLNMIMTGWGNTPMRSSIMDKNELMADLSVPRGTIGARTSKRAFGEMNGDAAEEEEGVFLTKKQQMMPTEIFEKMPNCNCTSLNEHCLAHYQKPAIAIAKRGLSTIDPTTMDIVGTLEQGNYNAMMATIEHFTDAGVGEFYDELVPVINRPPDAALSVNIIATRFLPTMSTPIAPFAMPAVVSSTVDVRHAELELYGLAAKIPLNMFTTKKGCQLWVEMMLQVSKGFALTERYGAILALVGVWRISSQRPCAARKMTIDEYHNAIAKNWACLQHWQQNAFPKLVDNMDKQLFTQNATPGEKIMMISPDVQHVLTRENAISTRYDVSGPAGPATLIGDNLSVCTIANHLTYVVPIFRLPPDIQTHPLRHYAEIGEYITSFDETPDDATYVPSTRDRMVFTSNGWEKVTFKQMIEQLPFWDNATGVCKDVAISDSAIPAFPYTHDTTATKFVAPAFVYNVLEWKNTHFNHGDDSAFLAGVVADVRKYIHAHQEEKWAVGLTIDLVNGNETEAGAKAHDKTKYTNQGDAQAYLASVKGEVTKANKNAFALDDHIIFAYKMIPFTKANMIALHKKGIRVPFGVIYTRPWKQYYTADVMRMIKGNVAFRLNRDGMATITDNPDRTHSLIAERYQGTVVVYPQNAVFARNVVIVDRRIGLDDEDGESTKPIPVPEGGDNKGFNPMEFLFGGASICMAEPVWWTSVPENLNIVGTATGCGMDYLSNGIYDYSKNGHPAAGLIDALYGITSTIKSSAPRVVVGMHGTEGLPHPPNVVCRMESFWKFDKDNKATIFVAGNGYWQPWATYDDAHRARCGGVFEPRNDSKLIAIGSGR